VGEIFKMRSIIKAQKIYLKLIKKVNCLIHAIFWLIQVVPKIK